MSKNNKNMSRLWIAVSIIATVTATNACDFTPRECEDSGDCPGSQVCLLDTFTCGAIPDDSPIFVGGGEIGGGGSGVGQATLTVELDAPARFLVVDPDDDNLIWFGVANNNIDQIDAFDLKTGKIINKKQGDERTFLDLSNIDGGRCDVQFLRFERDNIFVNGEETWISCASGPATRIAYGRDVNQSLALEQEEMTLVIESPAAARDDFDRRLCIERGSKNVVSLQIRDTDTVGSERERDDARNTGLSQVQQLFPVKDDVNGTTFALAFDRGNDGLTSTLIPLQRDENATVWTKTASNDAFKPLPLPKGTHAVVLLDDIDPLGLDRTPDVPNVVAIIPQEGLARFFNYEGQSEIQGEVTFENQGGFLSAPPAATNEALITVSANKKFAFYASQNQLKVWRIPLTPNSNNDVRSVILPAGFSPIGIVPLDDTHVWVAYRDVPRIDLLELEIEQ